MKTLSATAAIALALTAGSALAADLPSRKGPPAFVPPPPAFSWTGFYGGVNIGGAWTDSTDVTGFEVGPGGFTGAAWRVSGSDAAGIVGGGQLGYNYQFNSFVVGIETDFQGSSLTGSGRALGSPLTGTAIFPFVTLNRTIDWFGTVRGRVGYSVLPTLLVYGTGGFAYGGTTSSFTVAFTDAFTAFDAESDTRTGWTAGGGLEYAFWPNWSAKVEYLFVSLDHGRRFNTPEFGPGPLGFGAFRAHQTGVRNEFHTVRAGVNYHFNLFTAPAPIVAAF